MIKFLVDTSSDYTMDEIKEKGLELVPMTISIGDKTFLDNIEIERNDFFDLMEKSEEFPKTSQPSPQEFVDVFEQIKKDGDELIYVSISSGLSGTYQSAALAKKIVDYDKIYLIDSTKATYVIKIMVDYGLRLREEGKNAKEIVKALEEVKTKIRLYAVLNTLDNLCRGGRVSKVEAGVGNLAKIKPVITLTNEGGVGIKGKAIGKKKATAGVFKLLEELDIDDSFPIYGIRSYGEPNYETFIEQVKEHGYNVTDVLQIGPTIGIHIGPGAFGIIVVEK